MRLWEISLAAGLLFLATRKEQPGEFLGIPILGKTNPIAQIIAFLQQKPAGSTNVSNVGEEELGL